MKIGYLVHDMDPKAGWGRLSGDIVSGAKRSGFEIIVLKEIDDGFEGIPVLGRGIKMFVVVVRAKKYLASCDVIHAIDLYPYGIIGAIANIFLKKKLIITLIGTYSVAPLHSWKTKFFAKFALAVADEVTSISNFTKEEVLKAARVKRDITIITPGIDLSVFRKKRVPSKEQFILSVGALKERKGYHDAIAAFALAKKELPNLKYILVGSQMDVAYVARLRTMVRNLALEDSVSFLSGISDAELSDLYGSARLFLLPSVNAGFHFEGFGIVFLEAAAAGLPVIGTSGNGVADAVQNGVNGFLVRQNDPREIADAISKILKDPRKWDEASAASYAWAKQNDLVAMNARYAYFYRSLCGVKR